MYFRYKGKYDQRIKGKYTLNEWADRELSKELGTTQKNYMQILELESTELENSLSGFNSKLKSEKQRLCNMEKRKNEIKINIASRTVW